MLVLLVTTIPAVLSHSAHPSLSDRITAARDNDHNSPTSVKSSGDPYILHAFRRKRVAEVMLPIPSGTKTFASQLTLFIEHNDSLAHGFYRLFSTPPPSSS